MATPKFTAYGVTSLPTDNIDTGGVYFLKQGSDTFSLHIRDNADDTWYDLGVTTATVDTVNGLTGDVIVDLEFNDGKLKIVNTGDGTLVTMAEIDLDARYRMLGVDIPWGDITGAPDFALDSDVLHKTGDETKSGTLAFEDSPKVPTPTDDEDAVNKGYVDAADQDLQDQIDDLEQSLGTGMKIIDEIDASTDPYFPENLEGTTIGDSWVVTSSGKIGGPNGRQVDVGNLIIAKVDGANPGDYASSEDDWIILQSDLDQATELVAGFAKVATSAQASAGTDDKTIITPKKLKEITNALENAAEDKFVRYDASQTLNTAEQTTARENIDAASIRDVEWSTKDW